MTGVQLLDKALLMRWKRNAREAALWMEKQGLSYEFGLVALVGSNRARTYGVYVARIAQRGWNR